MYILSVGIFLNSCTIQRHNSAWNLCRVEPVQTPTVPPLIVSKLVLLYFNKGIPVQVPQTLHSTTFCFWVPFCKTRNPKSVLFCTTKQSLKPYCSLKHYYKRSSSKKMRLHCLIVTTDFYWDPTAPTVSWQIIILEHPSYQYQI